MKEITLKKLVPFLDSELGLSEFPADESANGLQVEGKERVRRIGFAVDACGYVFRKCSELEIDFVLVHHGLIWGGLKSLAGTTRNRIKALLDSGISLYACHLPLDWHPVYGNNARILKILSVRRMGEFGAYHGKKIGCWGRLEKAVSLRDFVRVVDDKLGTKSGFVDFGKKVRNIGVVSGAGWSALSDAEGSEIDTFLTGEPSHSAYTLAEELGINLIFSGHYATETTGVKAVGDMLARKFGLEVKFIDHPTGL